MGGCWQKGCEFYQRKYQEFEENFLPDCDDLCNNVSNIEKEEIKFPELYKENLTDETYKKIIEKKKVKEESKKYIESLDVNEVIGNYNSFMEEKISKEYLVDIELNNPSKQQERVQNIEKISNEIFQEKTREEFVEQLMDLSETLKESVCYELYHEPEKFVKKDEIKVDSSSDLFIQGLLSSFLEQKGINNVIRKAQNNENTSKTALQLIFNGDAFNQIINFHYSYGENNDDVILNDEEKQKEFIRNKQINYAKILNKNIDDIIISKPREGSINFSIVVKNSTLEMLQEKIDELKKYEKSKGAEFCDINLRCLLSFCEIDPEMFDHNYDQLYDGWEINGKRGPPGYLMDYDPPIGYKGYGLKVSGKYDNGDDTWLGYTNQQGEWYIAYHGTSGHYANAILKEGLKKGGGQAYEGDYNINPLSKDKHLYVGRGVYCSPKISVADGYASEAGDISFDEKKFRIVFMLRVNPYKIRISQNEPDYWVFEGDYLQDKTVRKFDDEVRPYRILIKEIN